MFLPTGHRVNGLLPLIAGVDGADGFDNKFETRHICSLFTKINDNVIFVICTFHHIDIVACFVKPCFCS